MLPLSPAQALARSIDGEAVCSYALITERALRWEVTHCCAAVCPKGLTLSNDTTTCIDMGVVEIGKKIYNDPTLKKGINQTEVRNIDVHASATCALSMATSFCEYVDVICEMADCVFTWGQTGIQKLGKQFVTIASDSFRSFLTK